LLQIVVQLQPKYLISSGMKTPLLATLSELKSPRNLQTRK